ncbi:B3 domain-containing transcription factor VRN1-like [Pyrus communis]|uniref:B3 domain-containing transcription factor VRN1-like n=1 Tax=Pyrus communis TaxID=23211 RepID=UPI0035C21AFB
MGGPVRIERLQSAGREKRHLSDSIPRAHLCYAAILNLAFDIPQSLQFFEIPNTHSASRGEICRGRRGIAKGCFNFDSTSIASVPPENINRPIFSPTTPHFFKIILEDTSKDRKFRIPRKFVMKYGEGISNPVCLKLPSGSEWIVELRRWDGEVWFDNGWPEFSKFYSLDCGHWLVFRYEGNYKFNVCIFDKSCTEIEYPLTMPKMELTSHDESRDNSANDSSDDYGEDLSYKSGDGSGDKFLPCPRKTREKSTLPSPQPHKKRITSSSGKCDFPAEKYGVTSSSTPSGEVVALRRAIAFKSQNPSFIVVMRLSYTNSGLLWLPSEFCKLRPIKKSCEVILQVSDGRTWTVDLRYEEGKATFRRGWMDIVCDNNLELGDVCVFVSTSNVKPLFDVFIFRSKEAASCSIDEGKTVPKMEESDQADGDSVQILDDDSTDDSSDEFSEDSDNNSSDEFIISIKN